MIQSNENVSPLIEAASNQASLNLFSSNSVVMGGSLLDAAVNNNNNNNNNSVNDLSASFSKLNTENIAQMINQAQLLNLNGDANKMMATAPSPTIIHPLNSNATKPMSNNFTRHNKFNNNLSMNINQKNYNNSTSNRNHMSFKHVRPPLNQQSHPSLMSMNFNFQQNMPSNPMSLNANVNNHHHSSPSYMPFGNVAAASFNHPPNSFFMHQNNAPSPPIQTHPSYFYNTNSFNNNKQSYMNYKSYLQAKKAEVLHFFSF